MGTTHVQASHKNIMPELLVFQDNLLLLVKGIEKGRVFWWSPGAYWLCEKICNLQVEKPEEWIKRVLRSQIDVELINAFLRGINLVHSNHPPVFIYHVNVEGEPKANLEKGFLEIGFFEQDKLPQVLGRDDEHGSWLRKLLEEHQTVTKEI